MLPVMKVRTVYDDHWQEGAVIELTGDEALVLFEYLARSLPANRPVEHHRAEAFLLARIAGGFDTLMPVFAPNYRALVDAARDRLVLEADGSAEVQGPAGEDDE